MLVILRSNFFFFFLFFFFPNSLRIAKIGNNSGLVESDTIGPDSEGGPNEREQPESEIFQRRDDLTKFEILLAGAWSIRWQSSLEEFLLSLGQPRCCLRNCIGFVSYQQWNRYETDKDSLQSGSRNQMAIPKMTVAMPSVRNNLG